MKELHQPDSEDQKCEIETNYSVPNLEKGLAVLELLSGIPAGLTLQEVRGSLKISLTTAYRILNTLVRHGYLLYEESAKKYYLSRKMLTIGFRTVQEHNLTDRVLPRMRALRDEIKESVFFGVLSEDSIIVLEKSIGTHSFCFYLYPGHKVALHSSAPGKAMVAALPPEIREQYLNRMDYRVYNENTISSREEFEQELERVQQRGYALDMEEEISGVVCISAPILDYAGLPCGCLWTSGPKDRLKQRSVEKIGRLLKEITHELSLELGHRPK